MLLDEPFGALDSLTRTEMQDLLLEVWTRFRHTIVFITHDIREAHLSLRPDLCHDGTSGQGTNGHRGAIAAPAITRRHHERVVHRDRGRTVSRAA